MRARNLSDNDRELVDAALEAMTDVADEADDDYLVGFFGAMREDIVAELGVPRSTEEIDAEFWALAAQFNAQHEGGMTNG